MEVMTFNYTKENGKVSDRVFVPITKPSENYFGVDITELSPVAQGEYIGKMNHFHNQYLAAMEGLRAEFDIVHNLRNFKPERMSDIEREFV